jgi:hypothetical protein
MYTIDDTKQWFQKDQQQLMSVSGRLIAWNVPFVCVCVCVCFRYRLLNRFLWRSIQRSAEDWTKWMPYSCTIKSYRRKTVSTSTKPCLERPDIF